MSKKILETLVYDNEGQAFFELTASYGFFHGFSVKEGEFSKAIFTVSNIGLWATDEPSVMGETYCEFSKPFPCPICWATTQQLGFLGVPNQEITIELETTPVTEEEMAQFRHYCGDRTNCPEQCETKDTSYVFRTLWGCANHPEGCPIRADRGFAAFIYTACENKSIFPENKYMNERSESSSEPEMTELEALKQEITELREELKRQYRLICDHEDMIRDLLYDMRQRR